MATSSHKLITCNAEELAYSLKSLASTRIIWRGVESRGFETAFSWSTRAPRQFRLACQYRYGTNDDNQDDQRIRQRLTKLPFKLFCFLGPNLSFKQIVSIEDEFWHHFVSDALTYVKTLQIPIEFENRASKILQSLPTICTEFMAEILRQQPDKASLAIDLKRNLEDTIHSHVEVEGLIQGIRHLLAEFEGKLDSSSSGRCTVAKKTSFSNVSKNQQERTCLPLKQLHHCTTNFCHQPIPLDCLCLLISMSTILQNKSVDGH